MITPRLRRAPARLAALVAAALAACGEDRRLEPQAQQLSRALNDTLVARGSCTSLTPIGCQESVFWDVSATRLVLGVYGVRDEGTVAAVRATCDRFTAGPAVPETLLRVHRRTKEESLRDSGPEGPPWGRYRCAPRRTAA